MRLALSLASERIGLTGTNPSVGCVIVKNKEIISIGQTGYGGRPHAENVAINSCEQNLEGSSIYVSLEPCSHFGKTPPCTNKIIKSKIKKVFYAIDDVDKRVSGKSYKILKKKKISVFKNILKKEAFNLYKSYFYNKKSKFPYVTGKLAVSKDFFISNNKKYITNKYSRKFSHLLRYKNQAILISSKTLNNDNPNLNCRIKGLDNFSPIRIILDSKLNININSEIVNTSKIYKTILFYNKKNKKFNLLKNKGIKLLKAPLNNKNNLDLEYVLKKLKSKNIFYLLIEGGKILSSEFIRLKLCNEFYLFKSNTFINNTRCINVSDLCRKIKYNYKNKNNVNTYLNKDRLVIYN